MLVVGVVLLHENGDGYEYKLDEFGPLESLVNLSNDMSDDRRYLRQELSVPRSELGPPRQHKRPQRKREKVVDLIVEPSVVWCGGGEERR